ncbi:MAG TPA: hypothetical protein EYM35_05125 [Rhodospirillales bacterium]|nr:hypothetical protein [Rhodospirillales bacterium]
MNGIFCFAGLVALAGFAALAGFKALAGLAILTGFEALATLAGLDFFAVLAVLVVWAMRLTSPRATAKRGKGFGGRKAPLTGRWRHLAANPRAAR